MSQERTERAERAVKVKIGVLGVTHPHARGHIRTLELMDEVSSIVAWDEGEMVLDVLKKEKREKLETTRSTLEQLLNRPDVPIVLSLMTNNRNTDMIIRAAGAGKHILTEKPVASSSRDIGRIISVLRHAGVHLGVFYTWRHNPIARDIRAMIEHGVLGQIMSIEARMVTSQVHFRDPSHWLFKKNIAGGGILSWLGCHWIDLIRFLTKDEVQTVSAMTATLNGAAIDVEDTATVLMQMKSGALASLHAGYLLPQSPSGYLGATYDTYLCFRGLKGNITWWPTQPEKGVLVESIAPGWNTAPVRELKYTMAQSEAYGGQHGQDFVKQFIHSALRKDPAPPNAENAFRVMQIIEAAYQSSSSGRTVRIDD